MKRSFLFLVIMMTAVCSLQAKQVSEADARQVANKFFSIRSARLTAPAAPAAMRLAYTAKQNRFYIYDRGSHGGFVIVAGDDRLPQVLAYGEDGDFSSNNLPSSVQYWVNEMNRQIEFLQSHSEVAAHQPIKHATAVPPLMTTFWNQDAPYNNYCPTYTLSNGNSVRAVTGCVATATAQVMNYYKWPPVGRGQHSYVCNVNDTDPTELSADFNQSVYQWDLMLDRYDAGSSPEACDAVARLMSDVGISMDMGYGSSSGASENAASMAMYRYFDYGSKYYWLNRDYYNAAEWDQFLVDEISLSRPVMYCGYSRDGGHAFVLDGFDTEGYFHLNWGWGGAYDGYFLVSFLAPGGTNFQYMQDGLFGMVPAPQVDEIESVLHIRSQLLPVSPSAPLGARVGFSMDNFVAEGNKLDTAGYEVGYGSPRKLYYALIPMSLDLYDKDGVKYQSEEFLFKNYLGGNWFWSDQNQYFDLPQSLEDGEYRFKLSYALDENMNYDNPVLDYSGKELYLKMIVNNDSAYFKDCFLSNTYGVESFIVPKGVKINDNFTVGVNMSYKLPWAEEGFGPVGNVYLSLLKDGVEVTTSPLCEVMLPINTPTTYEMQLKAPSEWGLYDVVLNDESGNRMTEMDDWLGSIGDVSASVFILPDCKELNEDFETMTANKSTSDKNVQGRFTTWSFYKSGVRAPGEGMCNGTNSIMMKKPSYIYSTQPLRHNFIMAQATFFNPTATLSKFKLEYSIDGGSTWEMASTIDNLEVAEVPEKSQYLATWNLHLTAAQPAQFRITMIGGGTGATYLDDISLYYIDLEGDVNLDSEVNIADINAIIDVILEGEFDGLADVNGDGEVTLADINALLNMIVRE